MKPGIQKRLKQISARVEKYAMQEPTGEYETCAVCKSPVAVHGGFDWVDGDSCDECLVKFARQAREDIPWLLKFISEKEGT